MTASAFTRCRHCHALDAPWSRGHAPTCPEYVDPAPVEVCPVCSCRARVRDVDPLAAVVRWQCRACDLTWIDDVRQVSEEHWTDEVEA